jgi:prostaglandin-H2 D-isomerase / glutathione transferase
MPLGQMPLLEIDGKKIHQSISICRYLAKQVGLAGSSDFESFEIDSVVDTCNDFRLSELDNPTNLSRKLSSNLSEIANWSYEADAKLKAEKRKTFVEEIGPFYLDRLEAIAKANNGHLALGKTTWADLWFTAVLDYLNFMNESNLIANYPNLTKVVQNTLAIDSIKKWVAKRPQTQG